MLTSVTGFLFHSAAFGPPHVIGVISLVILAIAIIALYVNHLAGAARWLYIVSAILALYLNVFVGVVQAFQKVYVPARARSRLRRRRPFWSAQLLVLVFFVFVALIALKGFPARTIRSVV